MTTENIKIKKRFKFEKLARLNLKISAILAISSVAVSAAQHAELSHVLAVVCIGCLVAAFPIMAYAKHTKKRKIVVVKLSAKK